MKKLALVAVVLLVAGCSSGGSTDYSPEELFDDYTPQPEVDWNSYPSSLKQLIDEAEASGDCQELQGYFDTWIEVSGALDVVDYVDDSLRSAGCYN